MTQKKAMKSCFNMFHAPIFDIAVSLIVVFVLYPSTTEFRVIAQTSTTIAANPALGSWSINPLNQLVTCIHSFLTPGPISPAPGLRPKLICVERPHGGGMGKYPPNPYIEPDNSRISIVLTQSNTVEIDLLDAAGTPSSKYAKISRSINNPFCGGHSQMIDGRIFMSGGDRESFTNPVTNQLMLTDGTNINRIYTPFDKNKTQTSPWTVTNAMGSGRWYPSVITLNNGEILIVGGTAAALSLDDWQAQKKALNPTYEYYPTRGGATILPLLQKTDPWNLYPVLRQLPKSGKVWIFSGGPSVLLDTKTGAVTDLPAMTDKLHHPRIYPFTSTAVTYPLRPKNNYTATIMICGGTLRDPGVSNTTIKSTGFASNYCSKVEPESATPKWVENFVQFPGTGKVMPDVVLMPDGKAIYVGGSTWGTAGGDAGVCSNAHDPSFTTYIFDFDTNTFSRGPDYTIARLYHSGALLLPDGRIITTGSEENNYVDFPKILANKCFPFNGSTITKNWTSANNVANAGCTQPFEYRIEIFTPTYYSLPKKPIITSSYGISYPSIITYGSNFAVQMDTKASDVASISFIRYSTTTHSTNNEQVLVELIVSYSNLTHLIIEAPPNSFIATPGDWMLFPVASNGAIGHSVTIRLAAGKVIRIPVPATPTSSTIINVDTISNASKSAAKHRKNRMENLELNGQC
ncbi:hypothetical protein HK096_011296 [Nowakowskiella sp. JEL0078]|nr:hypothetical protein HK096_011296 [Nowakowskiella sp. JEL0078]